MQPVDVLNTYIYNRETGEFAWMGRRKGQRTFLGHTTPKGYLRLRVNKRYYPAHHLVWLLETGSLPSLLIDHIDGNKQNNRFSNLREVVAVVNSQNQRSPHATNKSGYLGVSKFRNKWRAQIKSNGGSVHLGMFETPELAYAAYLEAKRKLHPGCTI